MKVWLIVVDDHHGDPAYMVMSTKEKAQKAMREILETNYERDGEEWYDCYGNSKKECIKKLFYSNGEDYVCSIDVELDKLQLVH